MIINTTFVKDKDNGKTLEELGVGANSIVTVSHKAKSSDNYYASTVKPAAGDDPMTLSGLMTPEMKLTEKAQKALTEIFARFSKDGKMTLEDCVGFTKAATGDLNATPYDIRVRNLYNRFATVDRSFVSLEQFLQFYEGAARERERTVWMNLSELGYSREMLLCGGGTVPVSAEVNPTTIPAAKLPRNLLSNHTEYFTLLLNIVRIQIVHNSGVELGEEVADAAWRLVLKLCPNAKLQHEVLHMLDTDAVNWEEKLPFSRKAETMYKLYIASALVMDVSEEEAALFDTEFYVSEARTNWNTRFCTKGGLEYLTKVFELIPSVPHDKAASTLIPLALHVMSWYILASLKANSLLPVGVKQIVIVCEDSTSNKTVDTGTTAIPLPNNNAETEVELQPRKTVSTYTSIFSIRSLG